ncbi:hypothetical protein JXO52_13680 [bacterium]|nr:hypothetical protein [bacterium]
MKLPSAYLLLLLPLSLHAGDHTRSFLNIGVGARTLAMGGAFSPLSTDGTAFYWNPAGTALIDTPVLSFMYGPQFGSIRNPLGHFHYAGCSLPLRRRAVLAVNWIRLSVDDIPIYSELNGDSYWERFHDPSLRPTGVPEGYIQDVEDAFFFTFGLHNQIIADLGWSMHRVRIDVPLGVTMKWFRQTLGQGEASGLGVDIGAMCRIHMNDFLSDDRFGIASLSWAVKDIAGSTLSWNTAREDAIPSRIIWGAAYSHPVRAFRGSCTISWNRESGPRSGNRFGFEYMGFSMLALRAGMDNGRFSCGAGVRIWRVQVDYALLSHELDTLHRISCSLSLK